MRSCALTVVAAAKSCLGVETMRQTSCFNLSLLKEPLNKSHPADGAPILLVLFGPIANVNPTFDTI